MFPKIINFFTIFFLISIFVSCNEGLKPPPTFPSIIGTVYFKGRWPLKKDSINKRDSLNDLRVALFKNLPDTNLLNDYFHQNLIFSDQLADSSHNNFDSVNYKIQLTEAPITFKYSGIVNNIGSDFNQVDWRVISLLTEDTISFTPKTIYIDGKSMIVKINFYVDWGKFPPQPF